jgi:hypothetical protein
MGHVEEWQQVVSSTHTSNMDQSVNTDEEQVGHVEVELEDVAVEEDVAVSSAQSN